MIKSSPFSRTCVLTVISLAACTYITAAHANPVKMAASGRFDLMAGPEVGSLQQGEILLGGGSIDRMNWIPEQDQPRSYTINFPIRHIAWREFLVRFTPARSGKVRLTLMGPWEEQSKGVIYQQEMLWDDLEASGATIVDGSFESEPLQWESNGGLTMAAGSDLPAVKGNQYARTWHNATLSTTLQVTGGVPVVIRGHARAVVPEGFKEMKRILDSNSSAHQAARRFMRGANLGNYLEAPPGQDWGAHYSAEDFRIIKREGFDHVRIPIAWNHYTGPAPDFKLSDDIHRKVDFMVTSALQNGLNVIVNIHHFDAFTSNPKAQTDKLQAIWRQVAAHYADAPPAVAFELLNEPKDAATTETVSAIYPGVIKEIRKTNPRRTIFVGPSRWNQVSELPSLRLPDDDTNIIVTVHSYDPFYFTHQGATWAGPDVKVVGIRFPGPPPEPLVPDPSLKLQSYVVDWIRRYNTLPTESNPCSPRAFRDAIQRAKEWSDYYGRPVHMGEFGCYTKADPASRARFYSEFRQALDEAKMGWAMWDWKAGFRYWNDQTGQPEPGMREAMFGNKRMGQ